jgi:ribose transport system ATP-binding protein
MIPVEVPILALSGIEKEYPGVKVLAGIDMEFRKGEIHGLIGENGAGKSTLVKILAGIVRADSGEIRVGGRKVEIKSSKDSNRLGLSFIHQELNLIEYLNAAENIFLGHRYPKTPLGTISWKKLEKKAGSILKNIDIEIPLDIPVSRLSSVDRSMVTIARAFAISASVYFMDEPTTALAAHEKATLFEVIRKLSASGASVIYISHDLDEVLSLADRITVMRDGKAVRTLPAAGTGKTELIQLMTGRSVTALFPPRKEAPGSAKNILSVRSLCGRRIRDIDFDVRSGEILGIAGILGSGSTDLLRTIYGADPVKSGSITLDGKKFEPRSPADSIRRGLALVPGERRSQGLILGRSVKENISIVHLNSLSRGPFLDDRRAAEEAVRLGKIVQLKTARYENPVYTLSGGNQQKIVFAKYMVRPPKVFMLDEPTKGVDVVARYEIYSVIRELAAKGSGILLAASDFSELLGLADRIVVMHEGEVVTIVESRGKTEADLLTLCYGKEDDR